MIHVSVFRLGGQCIFEGIAVDPGSIVATLRVKVEEALGCSHDWIEVADQANGLDWRDLT